MEISEKLNLTRSEKKKTKTNNSKNNKNPKLVVLAAPRLVWRLS